MQKNLCPKIKICFGYVELHDFHGNLLCDCTELGYTYIYTHIPAAGYHLWSCQNVCDALSFLLDNIYIRFGTNLYRQIVGIPMGTNCAPLVADLFLL